MAHISPNGKYRELSNLYKTYLSCVDNQLTGFLKETEKSTTNEQEWCNVEKTAYLEFMKINYKTQYDNILRLENLNF